jgi:hypothetical protein
LCNLSLPAAREHTSLVISSPQPQANRRSPRFRLADTTPAVLQFQNGRRTSAELQVISRTGGLLFLPQPMDQGSVVKLTFQTERGPVLGTAEMLVPVTDAQQPFRFVALPESDQCTLQAAFQSGLYRNTDEEEWIEDFRAAAMNWNPYSWKTRLRVILAAATLATIGLGSAVYFFSIHLR